MVNYKVKTIWLLSVLHVACSTDKSNVEVLKYVDTRVGTAASIANITVTQVEEPMGYVSPIVGNPSALTHWTLIKQWKNKPICGPKN